MFLDTEEDRRERARRLFRIVMSILILTASVSIGIIGWSKYHPLPFNADCKKAGYDTGITYEGNIYCYRKCVDNEPTHCKEIRVLT